MASSTPRGFPYPVGTDLVSDGDNAIKALAEAVDTFAGSITTRAGVQWSTIVNVNIPASPTTGATAVTFPAGLFAGTPTVVVTANISNAIAFGVSVGLVSTAGATIYAARFSGAAYTLPVHVLATY